MADIPDYMRDFDMDQDYGFTPVSSKPTESKPAVDPKLVENSNIEISKVNEEIINFITYSSDQRPWPFNSFPESSD